MLKGKELFYVKVLFVAGFGPVVQDAGQARAFYVETLGLRFEAEGEYLHTGKLEGVKHFALWPLGQVAQSCFGSDSWPDDLPVPQAWVEFEVDDLPGATAELQARGYRVLTGPREEPWGQSVSRLLGPEGLMVGVTVTPSLRS